MLKLNVNPNDISTCHRLGRKPVSQGPDRRKIIVKLCRRDMKHELFGACRKMKPRNVYINESLTKQRETIAYALRKMKRDHANVIKGVSTFNGRIYVWVINTEDPRRNDRKEMVNTYDQLNEFSLSHLNKPVTDFIETWPH